MNPRFRHSLPAPGTWFHILSLRWTADQRLRFLVVGAINTAIGYLIFLGLFLASRPWVHYLVVALVSHAVAVCFAFYLHRRVVFRSRGAIWVEFLRFNASLVFVLLGSLLGLYLLVAVFRQPPLLAQGIVTLLGVVASYLLHRYYSFQKG